MYQLLTQSIKRTTYVTYICIALLCLGLLGSGAPYVSAATTTISGTVYSDLGETAVGAGKTVGVAVQGKDAFTHISEVSGNGDAYSVAWNGDYIAVGSNWSQVRLYERSGSTLTYRDTVSTNGEAQDVDWNGDYLAVAHSGGNNVTTFKLNRGSKKLDTMTSPAATPDKGWSVDWNGDYLAVGHGNWASGDGQNLSVYKLDTSTDTWTELTDPTPPDAGVIDLDWSGNYLAVATDGSGSQQLQWYELNTGTDTLTQLTDPAADIVGSGRSVAWNGDYLAAMSNSGNRLYWYKRSGSTLTQLTDPTALPSASPAWRSDYLAWYGDTLAVAYYGGDNLLLYERDGDTLNKLANPSTMPTANGIAADWSDDGYLGVAHAGSSGNNLTLYQMAAGAIATTSTTTDTNGDWSVDLSVGGGVGQIGVAWVEDGAASSTTLWTDTFSTSTRTTVPLYADTIVVHGTSATTTLANAAVYDADDNNNIRFMASSTATTSFTAYDDFYVASGTAVQLPDTLKLQGNFANYGTVLGDSTAVELLGSEQILRNTATTTFASLEKSTTTADTLWFGSGSAWDITDSLTLAGADNQLLSLRSTTSPGAAGVGTWEGVVQSHLEKDYFDTVYELAFSKPAGTASDDVLVAVAFGQGSDVTYTWPTGWTKVGEAYTGFANLGTQVYWAKGDVADTTVSFDKIVSFSVVTHRFSGVDTTTPIRDSAITAGASDGKDQPTGSVTAAAGDAILASWVTYQPGGTWGSVDSGYTTRVNTGEITNSPDTSTYDWWWAAATRDNAPAGATGAISHSQNNAWQWRSEAAVALAAGTAAAGTWYIDAPATTTAEYLDLQYANNIAATAVECLGCTDSGNNTNWTFATTETATIETDDISFYVAQADAALPTITVNQGSRTSITSANDIRIKLPTTAIPAIRFDNTVGTVVLGGTAAGKVSASVSYEESNTVAVITVNSDLAVNDTLTIDGLVVENLTTVGQSGSLELYINGATTGDPTATATNAIWVTGSLTQSAHASGQASNQFSFQGSDDATVFAFSLIRAEESMTISSTTFRLSGHHEALSNIGLYQDNNSDGEFDYGDTEVASNGTITNGILTFTDSISVTTSHDYILVANVAHVSLGTSLDISVTGMEVVGVTSGKPVLLLGAVAAATHKRGGGGGGGGAVQVNTQGHLGEDVPTDTEDVTGGGGGGGGHLDPNTGDSLILTTGYFAPSSNGGVHNEWSNGANAYTSDGSYTTVATNGAEQSYEDFGINIPSGNAITGITVQFEANSTAATGNISIAVSGDGGVTFTAEKSVATDDVTDTIYTVGGESDTWGRAWSRTEFADGNFVVRVTNSQTGATTHQLDALQVRPHHQATGGGGGGGGALGFWSSPWFKNLGNLDSIRLMANLILSL